MEKVKNAINVKMIEFFRYERSIKVMVPEYSKNVKKHSTFNMEVSINLRTSTETMIFELGTRI